MKELQRKPNTYNLLIRIQKVLQRFWPQEIFIQRLLISLLLYSILVFLVAIVFGYHKTPDGAVGEYKNYFQKASWNLYPIFFFIIGVIVRYTWNPFQEAWLRTSKQTPSIVFKENIGEISVNDAKK